MTDAAPTYESDHRVEEELRTATRALLRTPLLRAVDDQEAFGLVRRHRERLRQWFDAECGWQLVVDGDLARLRKRPADTSDGTRPATETASRRPFTRRRYVLLCLALAVLERSDQQITLGRLADDVLLASRDPALQAAGFEFTLERREQRADLVAVVRLLLRNGVLTRVVGSEEAYLQRSDDVLYDVERRTLILLTAAPRGASTIDAGDFEQRIAELHADPLVDVPELRARRTRRHLTRRLVDDPVVYRDELDAAEADYLAGQRAALVERVERRCGLVAEIRDEGIAMVDPDDELTDRRMPESGTEGHATLLIAEHLAGRPDGRETLAALESLIRAKAWEHRTIWRRSALEPGSERELVATAVDRLEELALVIREADAIVARPALARYAVAEPTLFGGVA